MKVLIIVAFIHVAVGAALLDIRRQACVIFCPGTYAPVCGTNGITYANSCYLFVAQCRDSTISLAHKGVCLGGKKRASSCAQICPAIYAPLCGSDDKTYSNKCQMDSFSCMQGATITVAHHGACDGDLVVS